MFRICLILGFIADWAAILYGVSRMDFLAKYKGMIFGEYGWWIAVALILLWFNVTAILYTICRSFSRKQVGRKLEHMDDDVRHNGGSVMNELSERLARE